MISLHNMLPFELTKDTPYLALSGELWSVFYEYFNRNWSCYKGFLLYLCGYGGIGFVNNSWEEISDTILSIKGIDIRIVWSSSNI